MKKPSRISSCEGLHSNVLRRFYFYFFFFELPNFCARRDLMRRTLFVLKNPTFASLSDVL